MKIGIIVGSTRNGRAGESVGQWVAKQAAERTGAEYELVDLAAYNLPMFDEATHPMMANKKYASAEVQAWSDKIDQFDGYIFITPGVQSLRPGRVQERRRQPRLGVGRQGALAGWLRCRRRRPGDRALASDHRQLQHGRHPRRGEPQPVHRLRRGCLHPRRHAGSAAGQGVRRARAADRRDPVGRGRERERLIRT